jgi:sugar phosphate isomerase/epimerase
MGSAEATRLWAHNNLVAWCLPFDAQSRGPEERIQMLERLGFKHYAFSWFRNDIPRLESEVVALQEHRIDLLAAQCFSEPDDPVAKATLEVFRRHNLHPQLWIILPAMGMPKTYDECAALLPKDVGAPPTLEEFAKLPREARARIQTQIGILFSKNMPKTPEEQESRVKEAANRIKALVRFAAPYGCSIELYNHNGWFGLEENQLAIIERLREMGITGVGMVYNFSHARDAFHDDSKNFPELWKKMKDHVVAVNITGMRTDEDVVYPSQGDSELDMMRTIEESGWRGPIGLVAEKGGDAEVTLRNYIVGLDWLAAELKQPGSGGPHPFPAVP